MYSWCSYRIYSSGRIDRGRDNVIEGWKIIKIGSVQNKVIMVMYDADNIMGIQQSSGESHPCSLKERYSFL